MTDDLLKLRKIISKTFRKAKRWYSAYLLFQFAVLIFAVISIFVELNPNLSAVIAFLAVLATETVRWRSDCWKSEGEAALRKWEMADGLGVAVDRTYIADWLAAKPKGFLADVIDTDVQGSEFDSGPNAWAAPRGKKHAGVCMVEQAPQQPHGRLFECRFTSDNCGRLHRVDPCIASLKNASAQPSITVVQNVGESSARSHFCFFDNIVRLLMEFWTFAAEAKEILNRCAGLLGKSELAERDALSVLHDYQTARSSAPLLPTFVWKFHCNHLREQWADFRQEPGADAITTHSSMATTTNQAFLELKENLEITGLQSSTVPPAKPMFVRLSKPGWRCLIHS